MTNDLGILYLFFISSAYTTEDFDKDKKSIFTTNCIFLEWGCKQKVT